MEGRHRDILVELREKIVDDLDVYNDIIDPLTAQYVLRNEDVRRITAGATAELRAQILLDILPNCGPYAFEVFHRALEHHYNWLSDAISDSLRSRRLDVPDMDRASPGSPNLPPQPNMTVTRVEKTTQLKNALVKLAPEGYVALHGMKGFGKSSLAANTLKDSSFVRNTFNNQVYWIKFGYERSIENEILIQLNFLYHQVRNCDNLDSTLSSEPLKEHLVHYLRNHFGKERQRNALLILDDVWSKKIIDAFDFHCKTLVITTDIGFLEGKHREIVKMNDGFTEAESLGLFAKVLDVEVDQLPVQAKWIHHECNGMPILIAMFAAQFENFKYHMTKGRWEYYLESLRNKDSTNDVIGRFLDKQKVIFNMCIDELPDDAMTNYEALAIFSQDVNIMPLTLKILWDEEVWKVEDRMLSFCHKSLAAKHWNVDLKSYVYGVHDLLLCHLRERMGPERLRQLHKSFVEKYEESCGGDFSQLPNDNYSFSYIGHHLQQSGLYGRFPELYFDFDFIREKICHTGISDLLIDLKKYRKLIIGHSTDGEANVRDLEKFLENQAAVIAEHRRRECLDLIQIGLNHSPGYVRDKATALAIAAQPDKLYVTHDHSSLVHSTVTSEEVSTEGNTACFTDDDNQILIGNYSGEVILWDCKTRNRTGFSGHSRQNVIKKIIVAKGGHFFLTLCDDGLVKLFLLREEENQSLGTAVQPTTRIQSPRDKQPHWKGMFSDKTFQDDSSSTFSVNDDRITDMALSSDDKLIGVCTGNGVITVWNDIGETFYTTAQKEHQFERITFTREGTMLHVLDRNGVLKIYVQQIIGSFCYVSAYNLNLQQRMVILFQAVPKFEKSLVVVTEANAIYVKYTEAYDRQHPNWVAQVHSFSKQERAKIENPDARFTCATVTYDGVYLITGDSEGLINVWNLETGTAPIATFKGRVNSLDTYFIDDECHLICGCGHRVIHRWLLALENLPKSVRKPLFDAVMKPWGETNIIAKETAENTIVLCHGDRIIAKTDPVKQIVRLSLNSQGDKVVYATDDGLIMLFDQKDGKSIKILKPSTTPSILTFIDIDDSTMVVCGMDNDLKLWTEKVAFFVPDTGSVISIHTIGKKYVATVARSGDVTFFAVNGSNWVRIKVTQTCGKNETLCYSCMSPNERSLTVLKSNGEMIIYDIIKDFTVTPPAIDTDVLAREFFDQKLCCCAYSRDDKYLAIGLESGLISIFDIPGQSTVTCLDLHCTEVRQLFWSPNSIESPILLSVNCDELAWWNVAPVLTPKEPNRRSRMGMSRSSSSLNPSPRASTRLPPSQSLNLEMAATITNGLKNLASQSTNGGSSGERDSDSQTIGSIVTGHVLTAESYWKSKTAKQKNRPALLAVVPLPPSCNSTICVSQDFRKFLFVDVHGSVNNFELFCFNLSDNIRHHYQ